MPSSARLHELAPVRIPPVLAEAPADRGRALRVVEHSRAILGEADIGLEANDRRRAKYDVDLHGQMPMHLVPLAAAHDVFVRSSARRGEVRNFVIRDQAAREIERRGGRCLEFFEPTVFQARLDMLPQE